MPFFHSLFVLGQNTKRETGRKVQAGNINAAKVRFLDAKHIGHAARREMQFVC